MSQDVEVFVRLFANDAFLSSAEKSTLPGNESLLLAYVRLLDGGAPRRNALCRTLTTDTNDKSILNVLKEYFRKFNTLIKHNISSNRWSTYYGRALSWIYRPFKTKCTGSISKALLHPPTAFSC
ncbi:hypothetical protein TNCV_4252721 [Trichonephila clavipes]|nr:hypothetical protein TNCV_4252721 [Trichonephila clavipes]